MKAIILKGAGGIDRLHSVNRPDPGAPGPGEVRVAIHGSSLNYHDYAVVSGMMPAAEGRVPLTDAGGIIEAVGDGVTDFVRGDMVVACYFPDWHSGEPTSASVARVPGDSIDGYAQQIVVRPMTAFTRAPKKYDAVEGATITTAGVTAWRSLVADGKLKAGDTVLALGTGGVSIWALQIARLMGARVAITSSSDEKLERARAMGAEFLVNYRRQTDWGRAVRDWTDGRGVDHVIEVGGPATLAQSIVAVRIGGHISLIGILTGISGEIPTLALLTKQIRLQGVAVASRETQREFIRALDAANVHPVIDRRFGLEELAEAFRLEEHGGHLGKIGISW